MVPCRVHVIPVKCMAEGVDGDVLMDTQPSDYDHLEATALRDRKKPQGQRARGHDRGPSQANGRPNSVKPSHNDRAVVDPTLQSHPADCIGKGSFGRRLRRPLPRQPSCHQCGATGGAAPRGRDDAGDPATSQPCARRWMFF